MSNGGLTGSWCKRGQDAAKLWGDLLNVEVLWKDGEFDPQKQREKIETVVDSEIVFLCVQTLQTGALANPVKRLAKRNIPVISMDTLLVERPKLRETGVWTHISANLKPGSADWKRTKPTDEFRADVRKIAVRVESSKPAYSGPIYIDNVVLSE